MSKKITISRRLMSSTKQLRALSCVRMISLRGVKTVSGKKDSYCAYLRFLHTFEAFAAGQFARYFSAKDIKPKWVEIAPGRNPAASWCWDFAQLDGNVSIRGSASGPRRS